MPRICFQTAVVSGGPREVQVQLPETYEPQHLHSILPAFSINQRHATDYYVTCRGHVVEKNDILRSRFVYRLSPRLVGGKGGFGSMLRAIGAQIEKTTSREACRDLSGRRMRDVNNEKKLKDWVAKQSDREKEKAERKRERRERQLAVPEHKFADRKYDEQKTLAKENLEDALQAGLKRQPKGALGESRKRKSEDERETDDTKRRAAEWLGLDPDELSDLGSSSDESEVEACPWPMIMPTERVGSSAGSNMSTAVQFSDADSKASSEWENPEHFVEMENGDVPQLAGEPVHSDELLERMGESASERGECSKSDAGSIRSERGECSRSDAGSVRSERGECSKSDAGSFVSELSHVDSLRSAQGSSRSSVQNLQVSDLKEPEGPQPIVLDDYPDASDLHALGMERLKTELMARGLKCGGTLEQRSERLYSVKGLRPDEYNPSIVSKGGKSKSSQR